MLMAGTFADEVCGDRQRLNDWVLHTSLRSLLSDEPLPWGRLRLPAMGRGEGFDEAIRSPADSCPASCPGGRAPRSEAEYRDWVRRHRAALARDHRPLRELAARSPRRTPGWRCTGRAASPLGVRPLAAVLQPGGAGACVPVPSQRAPRSRAQAAPAGRPARRCAGEEPAAAGSGRVARTLTPMVAGAIEERSLPQPDADRAIRLVPAAAPRAPVERWKAARLHDPDRRVPGTPGRSNPWESVACVGAPDHGATVTG